MLPILLLPLLPLVTTSFTPAVLPSSYDQSRNSAVAFGGVADAKITDSTLTNLSFSLTPTEVLVPTGKDVAFHEWCERIGIAINPAVRVITSDNSVAGRGAFAIGDLEECEIIAQIPTAVVFHPDNCAECFPQTAALISKSKRKAGFVRRKHKYFGWIQKRWQKIMKKQEQHTFYHLDQEQLWQPELTLYALDAVKEGHPWGTWISQWQRDDPTYRLFCLNAKAGDENLIDSVASNLKKSYAPYLDELHIKAALLIRLLRLNEERQVIPLNDDSETSGMYALLGSRAVALDDHVTGVIPFHDMINHSLDPNLSIAYTTDHIEIYTNCKIDKGQELFLCYTKLNKVISSVNALWALVQWGIPTPEEHFARCTVGPPRFLKQSFPCHGARMGEE